MKYLLSLFLIIPLFFASRDAFATGPKIDSVYADSIYSFYGITDVQAKAALGKPDKQSATFGNGDLLDLEFRNHAHTDIIPIKSTSTVLIWGQKDKSVDSSAGQVVFYKALPDGTLLGQSKPIILEDGLNVIPVPGDNFTYIELSIFVDPGPKQFAKSYLVDAVALLQDTTPPPKSVSSLPLIVRSITSYPNPFIQHTTIRFDLEMQGDIQLAVIDGLGREIDHIQAGFLENGSHEIPLAIKTPGFYFVRLIVNGQPTGYPLKITSR